MAEMCLRSVKGCSLGCELRDAVEVNGRRMRSDTSLTGAAPSVRAHDDDAALDVVVRASITHREVIREWG